MKTNPTSVLVIEAHPLMRESLCAAIASEPDLQVLEIAPQSPESFRLMVSSEHDLFFLASKPDIILFSLGNPGWQDLQALSGLRIKLPHVPILALTRNEVAGQEQDALRHGASLALSKSISRRELIQALRFLGSQAILKKRWTGTDFPIFV